MFDLLALSADASTVGAAWSIDTLLTNAGDKTKEWVRLIAIIFGAALIGVSAWFVVKIFTQQQGRGMNAIWALIAAGAGAFLIVGTSNISNVGEGINSTITELGEG